MAQTGTIKVAKPAKKDTATKKTSGLAIQFTGATNYTFKKNKQLGASAGFLFTTSRKGSRSHFLGIGAQYSEQFQYFKLSPFNTKTQKTDIAYNTSQNKSNHIELVAAYLVNYNMGSRTNMTVKFKLLPGYMIKNKNEYGRVDANDFNRFNLAGSIGLELRLFRHYGLGLAYSKYIFNGLKDENIYDSKGVKTGAQNSRTNLLSVSLCYPTL